MKVIVGQKLCSTEFQHVVMYTTNFECVTQLACPLFGLSQGARPLRRNKPAIIEHRKAIEGKCAVQVFAQVLETLRIPKVP